MALLVSRFKWGQIPGYVVVDFIVNGTSSAVKVFRGSFIMSLTRRYEALLVLWTLLGSYFRSTVSAVDGVFS